MFLSSTTLLHPVMLCGNEVNYCGDERKRSTTLFPQWTIKSFYKVAGKGIMAAIQYTIPKTWMLQKALRWRSAFNLPTENSRKHGCNGVSVPNIFNIFNLPFSHPLYITSTEAQKAYFFVTELRQTKFQLVWRAKLVCLMSTYALGC